METSLKFDMRAPNLGTSTKDLYAAALDMAAFGDDIGISRINLMEHHGSDDGYLPQPFVMGGGIAARTKRCRISLGAVILPLHDPVKVAEQIAVLDQMSVGRLEVIIGAGYVAAEFAMFKASMRDRGRLLDEGIDIILRALHGERFKADGREIFIRPLPVQKPENIIVVGGGVEASAKRAARLGLSFSPTHNGLFDVYDAECRRLGREPGRKAGASGLGDVHLSLTPDKTWPRIIPHLKHTVGEYAKWAEGSGAHSPFAGLLTNEEALRHCGILNVFTPDELIERARTIPPYSGITLMPLLGGLAPEVGWESLKLLQGTMPKLQGVQRAA